MNLQELMNQIATLGAQIRAAAASLAQAANNPVISMDEITRQRNALQELQNRQAALQASYDTMMAGHQGGLRPAEAQNQPRSARERLASNEYVRAFAYALRHGLSRKSGLGNENVKILYDALTESGGTTPGEDGGFLVPIDIDNRIHELMRELNPLADLLTRETVTAPTGWRVKEAAPNQGMAKINEMGTINPTYQPSFAKVPYALDKYGDIVPISNELLADEDANLLEYLARWFAKRLVITQNGIILTKAQTLTATALIPATTGADALDGLKAVLNKELDPAISAGATILCNQIGFDALDQLKDEMGRGLLQPDPTNATMYRIYGRPVRVCSLASMPDLANTATDLYIGHFGQWATLFEKGGLEMASTDIGGNAFRTDSTEVRGIARMGLSVFDDEAVVRKSLTL